MSLITIWKGGEQVAESTLMTALFLENSPRWPQLSEIECYYFPRLKLTGPVVWEVLAGSALGKFLDRCNLTIADDGRDDLVVPDLRYIHGRAEVMKGRPTVSTVLLLKSRGHDTLPAEVWIGYLPTIYEEFLRVYGVPEKAS